MSEPFLSEIKIFAFNFPPKGWALCNGQLLPILQNQALFSLLGTQYGGNGQTNFALPNFQGRVPLHQGDGFSLGNAGGAESHTITQQELPTHVHPLQVGGAVSPGFQPSPFGNVLGQASSQTYKATGARVAMAPESVTNVGGSQPHNNMQPYLTLNFCISLQGIFPSQT